MIKLNDVSKSFGSLRALDGVDMNIKDGAIYGLVGTNGSGKTTILKNIAGIFRPDSGTVTVDDEPVYENISFKERMAFIPDELYFYGNSNLDDMASMYAGIYPGWDQERFVRTAEFFELNRKYPVTRFSKGMQKQAAFTLALSARPGFLLLDEPADGLDPLARRTIWDLVVTDVAERNMTVVISSHNLKEIEGICDTVAILTKGRIVLESEIDTLRSNVHKIQAAYTCEPEAPYEGLDILSRTSSGSVDILIARNPVDEIREVIGRNDPVILDILPLTLEEIFIYELGGENDEFRQILV